MNAKFGIRAALYLACLIACVTGNSQDVAPKFNTQTEASRLEAVRQLIRDESTIRLHQVSRAPGTHGPDCTRMLNDLLQYRNFDPIEPVRVLEFDYYPVPSKGPPDHVEGPIREAEKRISETQLGAELSERIRWCASEPPELGGKHLQYFDGFEFLVGAPPYRFYDIPKQINPHPEAELFFWAEYEPVHHHGAGYAWVNLKRCSYIGGESTVDANRVKDPDGHRTAVARYGKGLAVWSIGRHFRFEVSYWQQRDGKPTENQACAWRTYPTE